VICRHANKRGFVQAVWLLAAGCHESPGYAGSQFMCDETHACPEGQQCALDGFCRVVPEPSTVDLSSFSPCPQATDVELVGSAGCVDPDLQLTPDQGDAQGAAWIGQAYDFRLVRTLSIQMTLSSRITTGGGADGFAIVIHSDLRGRGVIGGDGAGLGYAGISPSFALEIDTYQGLGVVP
jgi:hypothetical protein